MRSERGVERNTFRHRCRDGMGLDFSRQDRFALRYVSTARRENNKYSLGAREGERQGVGTVTEKRLNAKDGRERRVRDGTREKISLRSQYRVS